MITQNISQKNSYDLEKLELLEIRGNMAFVKTTEVIFLDGVDSLTIQRSRVLRNDREESIYVESVIGGLGDNGFCGAYVIKMKLTQEGVELSKTDKTKFINILEGCAQLLLTPAHKQHYGENNSNFSHDKKCDIRFYFD